VAYKSGFFGFVLVLKVANFAADDDLKRNRSLLIVGAIVEGALRLLWVDVHDRGGFGEDVGAAELEVLKSKDCKVRQPYSESPG